MAFMVAFLVVTTGFLIITSLVSRLESLGSNPDNAIAI